jgi:RNA polymerase sigma factor for flagellar operon FliA
VIARRVARNVGEQVMDRQELESVGNEALVQAAGRYDPSGPASFKTFADYRIYGAMIDAIRQRTPGRRQHTRALVRLAATRALASHAADQENPQVPAGELERRIRMARETVRRASIAVRLSEPVLCGSFECFAAEEPSPEQRLIVGDDHRRLWALVEELAPRDLAVIKAIYVEGRSMKDVACETGTSQSTISRRHARILAKLARRMRACGNDLRAVLSSQLTPRP